MLNEEGSFFSASMVLCNELRASTGSSLPSESIYRGHCCKLIAISNTKKFNRRGPRLTAVAYAMEECAEQDEEVQAPRPEDESFIVHEHLKYLREAKEEFVVSVPIRFQGKVFAVLTLERTGDPYSASDLTSLRMIGDLAARRLFDLLQERHFGLSKRLGQLKSGFAWVVGVRHTWWKLGFLVLIGVVLFLVFFPWFYRVEASFELKASQSSELTAMIDGFIDSVEVEPGQIVTEGETLLRLDTSDLVMMENEALAKIGRLEADAARSRAEGDLMGNRLLLAEVKEENARLERIRYQIGLTSLCAPWDGHIIEGDLKERIGSPISRGDTLMRISDLRSLEVRVEIPENSIHEISLDENGGELAFASRPDVKYRFTITNIEPVGVVRAEGTVFLATATIDQNADEWWRPGMSGVAKIDVGERPLSWVLSHRLLDFIRLKRWI